jgi:hypothetical protein
MADEAKSSEINSMTVVGIGIVLFIVIIGVWYLLSK